MARFYRLRGEWITDQPHAEDRAHRLARTNHPVRTASFAYCFVVVGLVLWERGAGLLAWSLLALQFAAYPQLAFLHARTARDPHRAEIRNMDFDSLTLGAWVAMLGFPTWIAYAALFATTLNGTIVRGWSGAAWGPVCFAAGALAWILPMGYTHYPGTSEPVTALCFFGSLAYAAGVGLVVQGQRRRLRAAREELREGERRYRLITEHAGDLVAMVDRDGRWRYASPSYAALFAPQDLEPGVDAFRNVHEDDQMRVRGALQALVRDGQSCRLRMRLRTRGGDVRRVETLMHAVRDGGGAIAGAAPGISGAVLASRDVTELRDREEQLEIAGRALESMAEAMMITSADGRILAVNDAFARITGHARSDALGRHESELRAALQPASFYDDMHAALLRSGRWQGSTWCQRRDGSAYREWRSVSAVRDPDGRITHYVALFGEADGLEAGVPPPARRARTA